MSSEAIPKRTYARSFTWPSGHRRTPVVRSTHANVAKGRAAGFKLGEAEFAIGEGVLSDQQTFIFALGTLGVSDAVIAKELFTSVIGVRRDWNSIRNALGARSRSHLVTSALGESACQPALLTVTKPAAPISPKRFAPETFGRYYAALIETARNDSTSSAAQCVEERWLNSEDVTMSPRTVERAIATFSKAFGVPSAKAVVVAYAFASNFITMEDVLDVQQPYVQL